MAIQYIPPTVTKANRIKIDDINNNFESNNVEGALNEVCKKVKDQVQIDLNTYATKEELETKVDKEVGKSLIDDTEIERLKTVTNYNDTEIKASLEQKADKVELHLHENKSVLDGINQEKIDEWDKGIVFEDSPINDANNWKTFGYTKTNNTTINLPPQCSNDSDKWGILQIVKQHPTSGTQLYYPIDGQYKGRVFVRALFRDNWNSWTLLSTFSGSYNDLTNKPESFTPTSHRHDASEIDDLPTGESIDFGAENNWTGVNTFNNLVKLVHDNEVQRIEPTNANSACFYAFYKNKQNRSGHIGFESSSNNTFVIGNEMSNADIDMITKGSGRLKTNGKEVATQEALTNTIGNHKIWSGTQQEYDAIGTKDVNTLYFIKEEQNV